MAPDCPVDAAARCASNAASEQTTACRQPLRFPDGSSPTSLAFEADRPRVASILRSYEGAARGESTKQRGQRARLPQSKALGSNRRSCAFKRRMHLQLLAIKSLQPWPPLWPNARSKSLQPSAPHRSAQGFKQSIFASPCEDPLRS